jgi:hypothetical protein
VTGSAGPSTNRDQSREKARRRLERFATQRFTEEHREWHAFRDVIGPPARDGVLEAAEELLDACQRDLASFPSPVEPGIARELARDRFWAISALIYYLGDKGAKETQLRVTNGAPLAICTGDAYRVGARRLRSVQTTQGRFDFSVKGCRSIFPDVIRTDGGKMWPGSCPGCRSSHKKPARDQGRALRRRLDAIFAGRTATIYLGKIRSSDSS